MNIRRTGPLHFLPLLGALALGGCSSPGSGKSEIALDSEPKSIRSAETYAGTPLPQGARVKHERSFIVGSGENWFGRLTLDIGGDADVAYRFFSQYYPQHGWNLVSSVRTSQSLLVFSKPDRNLTIEITAGKYFMSGEAVLTVSPSSPHSAQPQGQGPGASGILVRPVRN